MCLSAKASVSLLWSFKALGSWFYKHLVPPGPKTEATENRLANSLRELSRAPGAQSFALFDCDILRPPCGCGFQEAAKFLCASNSSRRFGWEYSAVI